MTILTTFSSAPPFTVWHSHKGQKSRVLITAGVDGDEYAGIEAAKKLINKFTLNPPQIPLTIIPIVNLAGYYAKKSQNPLDNRYPKSIYPGSSFGTSSSRLMWQLSKYTQDVVLWVDLHGGATNENLPNPFAWADQTNNIVVDRISRQVLESLQTTTIYSHKKLAPAGRLAKNGTSYVILESGELGQKDEQAISWHVTKINQIIINASIIFYKSTTKPSFSPTYANVIYKRIKLGEQIPRNVLWHSPTYYAQGI